MGEQVDIEKLIARKDIDGLVEVLGCDENPSVRMKAAEALDQMGWQPDASTAGTTYWFIRLQSPDESVREDAARALVQIGKPVVDFLVSGLKAYYLWSYSDASSLVLRITAAGVLGKIGDPRAINALIQMGSKVEQTLVHRKAAAGALAMIGEPAFKPLCGLLQGQDANLQQLAAWALGKMGDNRAVVPLIPLVSTRPFHYPHVRAAAREALQSITGQDFGQDIGRWQEWLSSTKPNE